MAERERELRVVAVEYVCDKCGVGTMVYHGKRDVYGEIRYVHYCTDCNEERWFHYQKYPERRYRYADAKVPAVGPQPADGGGLSPEEIERAIAERQVAR